MENVIREALRDKLPLQSEEESKKAADELFDMMDKEEANSSKQSKKKAEKRKAEKRKAEKRKKQAQKKAQSEVKASQKSNLEEPKE